MRSGIELDLDHQEPVSMSHLTPMECSHFRLHRFRRTLLPSPIQTMLPLRDTITDYYLAASFPKGLTWWLAALM